MSRTLAGAGPRAATSGGDPAAKKTDRRTTSPPAAPRRAGLAAVACALVAFGVYGVTLNPTVTDGDSGELIAAAYSLGVAHPPGFPLYTILAKLFTLLPIETTAWRVHLFSAACNALAAGLVCSAAMRWTGSLWSGILAAGAFAFSPLVWSFATAAEVFPLNNLFAAGLLEITSRASRAIRDPPRLRKLFLCFALWMGLGLSNHHAIVFFGIPAAIYLATLLRGEVFTPRLLLAAGASFAAGLLPYLYLPLAAAQHPPIAWGHPETWRGFVAHLLRAEYGTFRLASPASPTGANPLPTLAARFAGSVSASTLGLAPILGIAAFAALRRRAHRALLVAWGLALAAYGVVFFSLVNLDLASPLYLTIVERFFQQAWVVVAVLMGVGLAEITGALGRVGAVAAPGVAIGLFAFLVSSNFAAMDRREHWLFRDQGRAILDSVPRDALLMTSSDEATGSVRYLQIVEGYRRDVRGLPTGLLGRPWYRKFAGDHLPGVVLPPGSGTDPGDQSFSCREFLDANFARFPIFIANREPWHRTLEASYRLVPMGLVEQVVEKTTPVELAAWIDRALENFARFDPSPALRTPPGSYDRYVMDNFWRQFQRFGLAVIDAVSQRSETGSDPGVSRLAIRALEPLAERHPRPDPMIFRSLGIAYQFLARTEPAAARDMARYWRRYLDTNPVGDRSRADIEMLTRAAERADSSLDTFRDLQPTGTEEGRR